MSAYHNLQPDELKQIMTEKRPLIVDVRNKDEVERGIIDGAIHIPLAILPIQFDAIAKAEDIVFYCHSGVRSAHAASFAANHGCPNVYHLAGGVLAWAKAGYSFVAKNS